MKQVRAMSKWDVTGRLHELKDIPALVLSAEQDRIAKKPLMQALADGLEKDLTLLEDAAHGVPLTDPARVNAVFSKFLASVR